jgi:hypothetical protein
MESTIKQRIFLLWLPSRAWLILFAAVIASGATFTAMCLQETRARDERLAALDAQVRFAVIAVDTKIQVELQQLRDLAASEPLKRRQFEVFYKEASLFAQRTRRQVVLHDVSRNAQVFNTSFPFDARLQEGARFMQKSEIERLTAGQPYVSNLFYATLVQKHLIAVAVPVTEDGRVAYLLGVALDPAEILAAVRDGTFAEGTVTSIVDRNGVILARSTENNKYAGRSAPSNAAARAEKSGRFKGATFDGTPIDISFLQSELTGWAAVSFVQDRSDSRWPYIVALIAALLVVVFGSIRVIATNAGQRMAPALPDESGK